MVPFLGVNSAVQYYEAEKVLSPVSICAKDALTVSSSSTAFKRVSVKWLTPIICHEPLSENVNKESSNGS